MGKPVIDEELTDQKKIENRPEYLRARQSLIAGMAGGIVGGGIGTVLWVLITISSGYQTGYMAVGVGFLVGFGVRLLGKGVDRIFGIMGAIIALLGCLAGSFFSMVGFWAQAESLNYFELLSQLNLKIAALLI